MALKDFSPAQGNSVLLTSWFVPVVEGSAELKNKQD